MWFAILLEIRSYAEVDIHEILINYHMSKKIKLTIENQNYFSESLDVHVMKSITKYYI